MKIKRPKPKEEEIKTQLDKTSSFGTWKFNAIDISYILLFKSSESLPKTLRNEIIKSSFFLS